MSNFPPFERRYVIKYGGNSIQSDNIDPQFAQLIRALMNKGIFPIIVHGGGPAISRLLALAGIESSFHDGLRVTNAQSMPYVSMALSSVGQSIVKTLDEQKISSLGLNGLDAHLFRVEPLAEELGLVGYVRYVNSAFIAQLEQLHIVPVIASFGLDDNAMMRNVNADQLAGVVAHHVHAQKLFMLTNVSGVYQNWPDENSLLSSITVEELSALEPILSAGMIPKIQACKTAVENGCEQAWIIDGTCFETLHKVLLDQEHRGTKITLTKLS